MTVLIIQFGDWWTPITYFVWFWYSRFWITKYFLLGIAPDDDNLLFLLNGGKSQSITPPPSDPTSSSTQDSRLPDAAKLEEEVRMRLFKLHGHLQQIIRRSSKEMNFNFPFASVKSLKCALVATCVLFYHQFSLLKDVCRL